MRKRGPFSILFEFYFNTLPDLDEHLHVYKIFHHQHNCDYRQWLNTSNDADLKHLNKVWNTFLYQVHQLRMIHLLQVVYLALQTHRNLLKYMEHFQILQLHVQVQEEALVQAEYEAHPDGPTKVTGITSNLT